MAKYIIQTQVVMEAKFMSQLKDALSEEQVVHYFVRSFGQTVLLLKVNIKVLTKL